MKKSISSVVVFAALMVGSAVLADEYGAHDYTGTVLPEAVETDVPAAESSTPAGLSDAPESSDSGVKCFWGYRWSCNYYYYYRPVVYYYRPCTYYYSWTYSRRYSYRYRYVTFYKSANIKSATQNNGIMISEEPQSGTPLFAQGIAKGDVITHIDGQEVTDPRQIDSITASSKLVVLKINGGSNSVGSVAPDTPSVEYGAFEY